MMFLRWILLTILMLPGAESACAGKWTRLDKVAYVQNDANDADSFHAKRNRSTYLFRLYFVDAPETDQRYPDRVKEQAAYFGVTPEQALKGATEAAEFVRKKLEGKDLEVFTQYVDARGASDKNRYYAMVKVEGRWLSELLVENGFARIHGIGDELPDGVSERRYWSRLRTLEREAKKAKRGLWGAAGTGK
jgi:endonuclease YncB( thermonuclease family)